MASIKPREYHTEEGKSVKRWKATITIKGCPRVSKTFDRKTDADEWAQKTEYEFKRHRTFGPEHHKFRTVGEAIERYSKDLELTNPHRFIVVLDNFLTLRSVTRGTPPPTLGEDGRGADSRRLFSISPPPNLPPMGGRNDRTCCK